MTSVEGDSMTRIKMCGIRRKEDIEIVNFVRPDYIGYVFAKSSRRYVTPEKARELTAMLDDSITPVGVFVDSPLDEIIELVRGGVIRIAQLHGSEDESYVKKLRENGVTVIRAFKVTPEFDPSQAESSSADLILLDSGSGSGKTFNWSIISGIKRDYFLAGGLSPENVTQALNELKPFAVDVSSGIETDGFKDREKALRFVNAVRSPNP